MKGQKKRSKRDEGEAGLYTADIYLSFFLGLF